MSVNHSVVNQRYQMREQKEAKKAPFDWLRLSVVLAGVAMVVWMIIAPQNIATWLPLVVILVFMATMLYAKTLQKRQLTR